MMARPMFAEVDINQDGRVDRAEWKQSAVLRFGKWDKAGKGSLDQKALGEGFGQWLLASGDMMQRPFPGPRGPRGLPEPPWG